MGLFELGFFATICAGFLTGAFIGKHNGHLWLGLGITLAILAAAAAIFLALAAWWDRTHPQHPACKQCQANDYRWEKELGPAFIMRCPCGAQYVAHADRFLELLPDDTLRPYMRRLPDQRWEPDAGHPKPGSGA